jgi:hypothetical protein
MDTIMSESMISLRTETTDPRCGLTTIPAGTSTTCNGRTTFSCLEVESCTSDPKTEDGNKCGLGKLLISRISMEMFLLQQLDVNPVKTDMTRHTTMLRCLVFQRMAS